jgi:hypothetical protein
MRDGPKGAGPTRRLRSAGSRSTPWCAVQEVVNPTASACQANLADSERWVLSPSQQQPRVGGRQRSVGFKQNTISVLFPDIGWKLRLEGYETDFIQEISDYWGIGQIESLNLESDFDYVIRRSIKDSPHAGRSQRHRHPRVQPGRSQDQIKFANGSVTVSPGSAASKVNVTRCASPEEEAELLEVAVMHGLALQGVAILHGVGFSLGSLNCVAVGPSCSGKSTLAASVITAGGRVVSDDALLVWSTSRNETSVRCFRRDLMLRVESLGVPPEDLRARFCEVPFGTGNRWQLRRDEMGKGCFLDRLKPDVFLALRIDRRLRRSRIREIQRASALLKVLQASTPLYVSPRYPLERRSLLPVLRRLVENTVCCELSLGRDLMSNPAQAVNLVAEEIRIRSEETQKRVSPKSLAPQSRSLGGGRKCA